MTTLRSSTKHSPCRKTLDMSSLHEIGKLNSTDKCQHRYLDHYEKRFQHLRNEPITLLEIGVWKGQSLRMWRDYFPNGTIFGIDVVPKYILTEERIKCFLGDQSDAAFLAQTVKTTGPLDFIVDDGGHKATQHVASFNGLWQHVKPGGWYCIEDCFSLFDECWTQRKDRTILDVIAEQWGSIMRGANDIAEVTVIGDGINDGLIFIRKRAPLSEV